MSWALFIQMFVLVLLVGCITMAVLNRIYEQPKTPVKKSIVYFSVPEPDPVEIAEGDMWINPNEGNKVRMWSTKKNDWIDVEP